MSGEGHGGFKFQVQKTSQCNSGAKVLTVVVVGAVGKWEEFFAFHLFHSPFRNFT